MKTSYNVIVCHTCNTRRVFDTWFIKEFENQICYTCAKAMTIYPESHITDPDEYIDYICNKLENSNHHSTLSIINDLYQNIDKLNLDDPTMLKIAKVFAGIQY